MKEGPANLLKNAAGYSIGLAVIMIVLGCLAMIVPMATGIAVSVIFGSIAVIGGIVYFGYAFTAEGVGAFIWRLLVSALYVVAGIYMLWHPDLALEGLTFVLACLFVVEGVVAIFAFIAVRAIPGAWLMLVDGVVAIVLGAMIGYNLPNSSSWAVGTLVGVNLLMSGFTRLFYSTAAKSALSTA